jgi:hypothetical protein
MPCLSTHRKRWPGTPGGDNLALAALETAQAQDELLALLNDEFTNVLVSQPCAVVRARVESQTWEAFHLLACENRP